MDVDKLKNQICKIYGFEKHPIDAATALLINDIKELQEDFAEFVKKNYEHMETV